MRTTVRLDDDVLAAAEQLRRERHMGLSEAVNTLARAGLRAQARSPRRRVYRQRTSNLGLTVDVSDVAGALDLLDGPHHG